MSPLQFQKALRLQTARLPLSTPYDAARADHAVGGETVGYESASQFSRDDARQFGARPARDMARLRGALDAA
ncbi:hypothetical protein [Sphingomonas sp.]|uniref:hypothetical protein n=1 Tax=Sphingomonas sp. TaxID=28214 RepID=UPI0025E47831|nr:hypothetical protein [Sphingomonas sp.]